MAIKTNAQKETLAIAYGGDAALGAIYTTSPGASAGTEPTGGSPAYARKSLSWSAGGSDGVVTATAVFDVPAGTDVVGYGVHASGGAYLDGADFGATQSFSQQGTLEVTFTYTQS